MAEMGADLAKAVIGGTISKVMSAIDEEKKLKERVQNDMQFMTAEFQMMQSFLGVADEERLGNGVVRTWVRQVRDLAYDVEDYFEVFVHLDLKKSTWWWRIVPLPPCIPRPLALDEAVASIKRLRARVEDVSQRNLRYRLIGDSGSKPIPEDPAAGATFRILRGVKETAWKQRDLRDLTTLLTGDDLQLQVISVWATAGDLSLKTSSIIRKAFADPNIRKKFPSRAWVKPMHPFNPEEFLRSLLTQFYANSPRHERGENLGVHVRLKLKAAADTEDALMMEFTQLVHSQNQRYLIVIEDLLNMVDWDAIRMYLPNEMNGSRIVVSTRQLGIASLCTGEPYEVSGLRELADDTSVCVFFNKGFGRPLSFDDMRKEASELMEKFELVGRHWEMRQLDRHILNSAARLPVGEYHVASVWGIAGVGKSALVRTLYYNEMLSDDTIFRKYSWVDVPHPFSLAEFYRRLHWYSRPQADEKSDSLIIIDGLRSGEEWELIKTSLSTHTQCTVIIVTDDESVATHCANEGKYSTVLNIKCLEAGVASDLFVKVYYSTVLNIKCLESGVTSDLFVKESGKPSKELTKDVAAQCGGLPKVIVEAGRNTARCIGPSNDGFMHQVETKQAYANLGGLMAWMRFFFRTCPDYLKPYIYYLSVFPANCNIRQRRLVRRWIAEGYYNDTDGRRAEENLDKIFSKLIDLSIIQRSSKDRLGMVSGFFRGYMLSRPMEDNLVFVLDGPISASEHRERHLSIQSGFSFKDIDMVYATIDFSRLRSLTLCGLWWSHFIPFEMLLLQVLDLEDSRNVGDADISAIDWVKWVPSLKFLSLRGCELITSLPSSLFGLMHLQNLDVRFTRIRKLQQDMVKLQKLQYFRAGRPLPLDDINGTVASLPGADASVSSRPRTFWSKSRSIHSYNGGVVMPEGMWKLEQRALDTLGVVDVSAAGGEALLNNLWMFFKLRKLGVSGINRRNMRLFSSSLWKSNSLESLSVRLEGDNEDYCGQLNDISPQPCLQSLKLYGPLGKFPAQWIKRLKGLRKLTLHMSMFAPADMEVIIGLTELSVLRLFFNQFQDEKLIFDFEDYRGRSQSVNILELACRSRLHVFFGKGTMGNLDVLKVHCSSGTPTQISGLENLRRIREVWLNGSCDEALEQNLRCQIANHPGKPILRVERPSN